MTKTMNLERARDLLSSTHLASLDEGWRANGYMLQSGPGIGKSSVMHQLCKRLARMLKQPVGLVVEMLASLTSPDIRGFMIPIREGDGMRTVFSLPPWYPTVHNIYVFTPDGKVYLPGEWDGEVPEVGILFLDEWGQADEDVRKPAAELILNGVVGTHRLPPGWRVVGAQNRMSDRSGVTRELMHIVNRRGLLEIEGDPAAWLRWADDEPPETQPHPLVRAFVRKQPDIVFKDALPDTTDPYCTPRSLCLMDRDIRVLRTEDEIDHDRFPTSSLALELCSAWIGKSAAAQFFTHIRFAEEIPDLDDIIAEPRRTKIPAGKDAQMICVFMLTDAIEDESVQSIVRYTLRFAPEMQNLAMGLWTNTQPKNGEKVEETQAQIRRAKLVMPLPECMDWIMKNKDVL